MKRYNPCHTPQGPASIQENERGRVVLYEEALQLERKMQFWHTRCRELKDYLRRIGDTTIAAIDGKRGQDHALEAIKRLVHDALNAVGVKL